MGMDKGIIFNFEPSTNLQVQNHTSTFSQEFSFQFFFSFAAFLSFFLSFFFKAKFFLLFFLLGFSPPHTCLSSSPLHTMSCSTKSLRQG
ncbi:hypothetical protein RchiOBHm_Chr0c31g0501391 [Rosa chinensis]|uniref:Uncharacterized protein n=1 Tax=Rosa chinensis TaxID=74649 RepID=A0A2P6SQB2_ROSCH|nr:hypothetical protein RchiOBHm_Chr0c31g0501391 [Rosa chinensis]